MKRTKNEFQQYYAREIEKSLGDRGLENVKINLKLPVIKEKLAQWLTNAIQKRSTQKEMIQRHFIAVGLCYTVRARDIYICL